jgi:hypothetical protein
VYTPEAGPDRPINVFQDQYKTGDAPIRLSYHDRNHYNAVVDPLEPTAGLGLGLPGLRPGLADKLQLGRAKAESDAVQDEAELRRVVEESTFEYRRSADDDLQRALKESAFSMDHVRFFGGASRARALSLGLLSVRRPAARARARVLCLLTAPRASSPFAPSTLLLSVADVQGQGPGPVGPGRDQL